MKKYQNNRIISVVSMLVCFYVIILTLGFSTFRTNFNISDIGAIVRIQKNIRVTNIRISNTSNDGLSVFEEYDVDSIMGNINLPNNNSTVTYDVEITNFGNIQMGISEIIDFPSNLSYSINGYTLSDYLCDDLDNTKCKLGSVTTLHITIGYAENSYDSTNTINPFKMKFIFQADDSVAKVGNKYYDSLQNAVNDVPTNNTKTIVELLRDTSELITVDASKNIEFDFGNNTLSNNGNKNVIINYGTIEIKNGTISTTASQGAINNEAGGVLTISGGRIISTGERQALYNNGGTALITGNAYLSTTSIIRSTVHNLAGGNLTITGGTIISSRLRGIDNFATLTIGEHDGNVNTNTPIIQGLTYGISSTSNYSFYDGIIKGKNNPFNDETYITSKEEDYEILYENETINGVTYKTAILAQTYTVIFNPNEGSVSENVRNVRRNFAIGSLPIPERTEYFFDGWFTDLVGGTEITSSTIISNDMEIFAHWIHESELITAKIGNQGYKTLQLAINAVPSNTDTTIKLVKNTIENVTVSSSKKIILDLQNYTITNKDGGAVIENNGNLSIINGTITTSSEKTSAINNNSSAIFRISSGSIIATGARQAIYNNGGTVYIEGDAYLTAKTLERATVHNLASSTLIITGGTINSDNQQAVNNLGTLTIGIKDGNIDTTSPILKGATYGVTNTSVFNFYDGKIKGVTSAIDGNISEMETNSTIVYTTEIDNLEYNVAYLS